MNCPQNLPKVTFERPEAEFPYWGRCSDDRSHALFNIIECLNKMNLADWVPHFAKWLSNYDGLEVYTDDYEDPHLCVREVLRKNLDHFIAYKKSLCPKKLKEKIVNEILLLEFVFYRAHWGKNITPDVGSKVWEPLKNSWFNFLQSGSIKHELHIWSALNNPCPTLKELKAYLLRL